MRYTIILFLFFFLNVNAQHHWCGTEPNPDWFSEKKELNMRKYLKGNLIHARSNYTIPVRYYVVRRDNRTGGFPLNYLLQMHCDLNNNYKSTGVQFGLDSIIYINSNALYDLDNDTEIATIATSRFSDKHCNVFIANTVLPNNCGFTYMPRQHLFFNSSPFRRHCIFVKGSATDFNCSKPGSITLTHEMGHWLDLPHTFSGWENSTPSVNRRERVARTGSNSNCEDEGDGFCDTDPDYEANRWPCPNNNNKSYTDPLGVSFKLNPSNFMCYASDECINSFSTFQSEHMKEALTTFTHRKQYENYSGVNFQEINDNEFYEPKSPLTTSNIRIPKSDVRFETNTYSNTERYHFVLARGNSQYVQNFAFLPSSVLVDTFLSEPKFTPAQSLFQTNDNNYYYWKLSPINRFATCGNTGSNTQYFRVSNADAKIDIVDNTCFDFEEGEINITSLNSNIQINEVKLNESQIISSTNYGMKSGRYTVDIKFSNNDVIRKSIEIKNPPKITNKFTHNGNKLEALASGGVSPYKYKWNTGSSSRTIDVKNGDVAKVTVTDKNNCDAIFEFKVVNSSIQNNISEPISLIPNFVLQNETFKIENLESNKPFSFQIWSINGQEIKHSDNHFNNNIETTGIQKGVYFINIQQGEKTYNSKFTIY